MYVGKVADTSIHDHHAIQIAISFDEVFEIELPGRIVKHKAVIIAPDQPHHCKTFNNQFLFLNIAPETTVGAALKKSYLSELNITALPAGITSEFIKELSKQLTKEIDGNLIYTISQQFLRSLSGLEESSSMDDRVLETARFLDLHFDEPVKVKELAKQVFISPGRLIHLFTEQTGIPIRKYILWKKLLAALQKAVETKDLAGAALYAGFSDAPHFNRTFKRMFGLSPSSLLKNSRIVQVY